MKSDRINWKKLGKAACLMTMSVSGACGFAGMVWAASLVLGDATPLVLIATIFFPMAVMVVYHDL